MTQDEVIKLVQGNQLPQYGILAKRELITPNRTCEVLGIDEIAIRKGHVYATVLYDHTRKSVIHMLQGRDRKSVHAFFKAQGKEWCESVKVVTCDLWRVYKSAVRKFLPNATVVTDKFHVFKHAGGALEELRRSEYNRQADKVMDFEYFRLKILSVTGYLRPYPRVLAF